MSVARPYMLVIRSPGSDPVMMPMGTMTQEKAFELAGERKLDDPYDTVELWVKAAAIKVEHKVTVEEWNE